MKRVLLSTLLIAGSFIAEAQFTAGNLAVYRIGDGTADLNTATVAVGIDEYNLSGQKVNSIAVPTTTSGGNFRLTAIPKASESATVYNTEGMSSLSQNGNYLTIFGYDQATGSFTTGSVPKIVGNIGANGVLSTNTSVSYSVNSTARAAISRDDAAGFYTSGVGTGIHYSTTGSVGTNIALAASPANARSLSIFNNKLYCAIGDNNIFVFSPLPTAAAPATSFSLAGGKINQVALFDTDGDGEPNLIYAADDGSNTSQTANCSLRKWALVSGSWVDKGTVQVSGVTDGLKSITGTVSGSSIELYAATWGNISTNPVVTSKILKITDANAISSTLNSTANAPVVVAEAPAKTFFRSITFTPGTTPNTVLPVKMKSFKAKKESNSVLLSWATSSETNNSHFEVLRSVDGKSFVKIGSVNGKGSAFEYHFSDFAPAEGINYYRLNQVDFDGRSELSEVVWAEVSLNRNNFQAWANENGNIQINTFASEAGAASIRVSDIGGRVLLTTQAVLKQGSNSLEIPSNLAGGGLYIVTLSANAKTYSTKLLKN